jgi:hypothetical protein
MANTAAGPLVTWRSLPDPTNNLRAPQGGTCNVVVGQLVWEKIVQKHVSPGSEPWAELWSPELVAAFRTDGPYPVAEDGTLLWRQALDGLEAAVRECLRRPLALLHVIRLAKGHSDPVWILVLRSGAKAIIRSRGPWYHALASCYFTDAICRVRNPQRRWLELLRRLVSQHVTFRGTGAALPGPAEEFRVSGTVHAEVRFVTPETWGFATELRGQPWRGRPTPWPDPAPSDPQKASRRLRPRRRRVEEGDGDA